MLSPTTSSHGNTCCILPLALIPYFTLVPYYIVKFMNTIATTLVLTSQITPHFLLTWYVRSDLITIKTFRETSTICPARGSEIIITTTIESNLEYFHPKYFLSVVISGCQVCKTQGNTLER